MNMLQLKFDLGSISLQSLILFSFVPGTFNDSEYDANQNQNQNPPGMNNFKPRTNLNPIHC